MSNWGVVDRTPARQRSVSRAFLEHDVFSLPSVHYLTPPRRPGGTRAMNHCLLTPAHSHRHRNQPAFPRSQEARRTLAVESAIGRIAEPQLDAQRVTCAIPESELPCSSNVRILLWGRGTLATRGEARCGEKYRDQCAETDNTSCLLHRSGINGFEMTGDSRARRSLNELAPVMPRGRPTQLIVIGRLVNESLFRRGASLRKRRRICRKSVQTVATAVPWRFPAY